MKLPLEIRFLMEPSPALESAARERAAGLDVGHEDVHVALGHALDDVRRRIEDSVRSDRGQEKVHAAVLPRRPSG